MAFEHVADDEIVAAITEHSSPPDGTPAHVRSQLTAMNTLVIDQWPAYREMAARGTISIVAETDTTFVIADHDGVQWTELTAEVGATDTDRAVLEHLHHQWAAQQTDHEWEDTDALVVEKPDAFQGAEYHVLEAIAHRATETDSVAAAVDAYASDIRGWPEGNWQRQVNQEARSGGAD